MKIKTFYESTLNATSQKPEYGIDKISLSEDNSFMIYKNNIYPLEFINEVKFGDPKGSKSIINENKIRLVGRDIAKHIIYRTEFRDFIIVFVYESTTNVYRFDSIRFQNKVYRDLF
jgi:hypothetical protein